MSDQVDTVGKAETDVRTLLALVANAPDGIVVVDDHGLVVQVNPRAEDMFDYRRGELLGLPIESLVPERARSRHVDHRAEFTASPRTRPMGAGLELRGRRRDGSEFPVDVSLSAVEVDGRRLFAAFVRDITARVEADLALRASEARFRSLVDSVPDYAIFTLDPHGRITSWGAGAQHLKGYSADQAVGQPIEIMYPPEDVAAGVPSQHLAAAAAQGQSRTQGWRLRRDGSRFWADVSLTAIFGPDATLVGYAKVTRDLTDQRMAETRMQALGDLSEAVLKGGSSEDVLGHAARRARTLADGVVSWAAVATEDGGHIVVAADGADAAELSGTQMPEELSAAAGERGRAGSVLVDWVSAEPALTHPVGPVVLAEVSDGGHDFGLLAVGRRLGAAGFTAPEARLVEILAAQAAAALALRAARLEVERLSLSADQERIARDLHDTVIQRVFAIAMGLQSTMRTVESEAARERIDQAIDDLDDTIRSIRTTIFGLQPRRKAKPTVRLRVLEVAGEAAAALGFDPTVHFEGAVDALVGAEVVAELVPTVREALSNAARHAHATRVTVTVQAGDDITLIVADNGIGAQGGDGRGGNGLVNMGERARSLGGSFRVDGPPGGGTRLVWRVPAVRREL